MTKSGIKLMTFEIRLRMVKKLTSHLSWHSTQNLLRDAYILMTRRKLWRRIEKPCFETKKWAKKVSCHQSAWSHQNLGKLSTSCLPTPQKNDTTQAFPFCHHRKATYILKRFRTTPGDCSAVLRTLQKSHCLVLMGWSHAYSHC